jgi:hypothetical protein
VKFLIRRVARVARSLRPADWRVLAESAATLLALQFALWFVDFRRLLKWAVHVTPRAAGAAVGAAPPAARAVARDATAREATAQDRDTMQEPEVLAIARLVRLATLVTRAKCLSTSLALARMLARRGITAMIRIGVRTEDGRLDAHAWVEWQGRVLIDHPNSLERFSAFDRPIGVPHV